MRDKLDRFKMGLVFGLIGPFIGFCLYGGYYCNKFRTSFPYFVNEVFLGTRTYQSPIATLSLLFNLLVFLIYLRVNWEEGARGILAGTACFIPIILFLFLYA